MRPKLVLLAGLTVVAALPVGVLASADGARTKAGVRCPTKAKPRQRCPRLRDVIPIRSDGRVGLDASLKAFAATIAPLPGVRPPKRGYPHIRSGSGPIRWLLGRWERLTPAQRAAVQKALPGIGPAGPSPAPPAGPSPPARAAKHSLKDLQQLATQAVPRFNAHFNPDLTIPVEVTLGKPPSDALDSWAYVASQGSPCIVTITPAGQGQGLAEARFTMLHELTHCYLDQLSPNPGGAPAWVVEGSAEWAGAALAAEWNGKGYVSPDVASWWKVYFDSFKEPLSKHAYSAIGYYAHLVHSGGDAFAAISQMYKLPDPAKQAYGVLFEAGTGQQLLTTIASSGTRLKPLGESWVTDGPMIPGVDKARYSPPSVPVGIGKLKVTAPAYGRTVLGLNPSKKGAEIVKLKIDTPKTAWGLLHHEEGDHRLQNEPDSFCARGKCVCPDGTKIRPLGDDAYLALYAHGAKAQVSLVPEKLDKACKPSLLRVTGAFNMTITDRGSCAHKSTETPSSISAGFFKVSQVNPQGEGSIAIGADAFKTGTYPWDIDNPSPRGTARVTKHGEPGGGAWKTFNRVDEPVVRNRGQVTITSIGAGGVKGRVTGTVDLVLEAEPPEAPSTVHLTGRWTCDPYDVILGEAKG